MLPKDALGHELSDILDLFTYRFLLDDPTDVINLNKDIDDLDIYPERIVESYPAEWYSYVQASLRRHPRQQVVHDMVRSGLVAESERERFTNMREKVKKAILICTSENLHLMKHPVRMAVERLIK